MAKSLPPLTWFRAFEAAARHLSFTLAADELGFTQSAISQHVRALEERLGSPLFIRRHRALQLTDAGRLLVPDVAAAMARLGQATERFLPVVSKPKLTIATSASIAQYLLAPKLSEFARLHPDIALQIVTTVWPDDFTAVNSDIEIRFGAQEVVGQNADLLGPAYLHAVAAPQLARYLTADTLWEHLAHLPLIQPVGISATWSAISATPVPLEAHFYVDTHGLAVDMALSGAGVALTHALVTREALADGRLIEVPLPHIPAREGYYLARNPSQHPKLQDSLASWIFAQASA
ncbi:LysR substrate-binding domain-containing protein [uncultured Roseobacter sp.]|uniref:LysR substrate-binding domain-containing protein n=1 Tax=uncultured Roseobacter sp. TaxID=114847 RepID=UPI0026277B5E|nr:LysR substrate-binding domain-containing protein [uncultured Roseobacter sp.]